MIFFLYGEDAFRAKQTIDSIKAKFKDKVDSQGTNIHLLESVDFSTEIFFDLVKGQGFFSEKKLIIIKNIFDCRDSEKIENTIINWLETQKDTVSENYVIFWQQSIPRSTNKLFKKLKSYKFVHFFNPLQGAELQKWIVNQAKLNGCSINTEAIALLTAMIGNDTWFLNNEIEKLSAQKSKTITAELVKNLVIAKTTNKIFDLVDACANKNKALAHSLINEQLEAGVEPLYLLAMIIRQFRLLARAYETAKKINNSYALANSLNIHPFVAKKILEQVRRYDLDQIKTTFQNLVKADRSLKYSAKEQGATFALLIENI